jgi:phosphoglucosamine mutase
MKRRSKPLSELAEVMSPLPQTLVNVAVCEKPPLEELGDFQAEVDRIEEELGDQGRVLVRYSGTESVCRVMVEGPQDAIVNKHADALAQVLDRLIGA